MRARHAVMMASAAFLASSAPVTAQCPATGYTADACQKTQDIFNYLTPQISTALAGGSTTLGQGGVLGGLPHWTIALRASAVNGSFPTVNNVAFNTQSAQHTTYPGKDQLVPMASIDASVGLYEGFPLGVTMVGGVDLLVAATYVPKPSSSGGEVSFDLPGGSTKFGYGLRFGLLQESVVVPGVSFSFVKRDLPTLSVSGTSNVSASGTNAPGNFALNDLEIKTSTWRISASKTFMIFGLQGGFGQDKYDNSARIHVQVNPAGLPSQTADLSAKNSMTRTNMYIGASLNFFIGKLVGEYGQVSGGSLPAAMNSFGTSPTASRSYFTLGLRTGF